MKLLQISMDPNDVSLVASTSQVIPKSYSLAIRKLCEKNYESADDAYELLFGLY